MPPLDFVTSKASARRVQDSMNTAVGNCYWLPQDARWRTLLEARNAFVRECFQTEGLTIQKFKDLEKPQKRYRIAQLERVFAAQFFQYTRDGGCWVFIHGMSAWHVRSALHSMQYYDASSDLQPASVNSTLPNEETAQEQILTLEHQP
ncbi:hypothetical protein GLAREA_00787 [Glarea lozoyensis ATCC 20868]|uniref:Uncharacterized protein n=1 Tax=Glarea lozoyensis (strain ATCC 20868 / MF5171) TaxID=1116229 RepID=S3CT82_GLAL2|nr:uncharacterized protein GLAREA_00787 [Glarea lozoyensis ATCC 20868]EPE29627.1 hypothetical protein GLAREA_00787 [Glarea lozoyensis ATCC 20868]